jgi:hypothetical protein
LELQRCSRRFGSKITGWPRPSACALRLADERVGTDEQPAAGIDGRLDAVPERVHDGRDRLTVDPEGRLAGEVDGGQRQRRRHILDQLEVVQIDTRPLELAAQPPPPIVVADAACQRRTRARPGSHQRDVRHRAAEVRHKHVRLLERRHRPLADQVDARLAEAEDVARRGW